MQIARDYNRSLAPPIRWLHILSAFIRRLLAPALEWATAPTRITWVPWVAGGFLAVLILLPWDESISRAFRSVRFGGDIRRELEAAQQYGQALSSLLVAAVIWLQHPAGRRRLADWLAAFVITGILATFLKMFLGRPRPLLDEPDMFLGPLGAYPLGPEVGIRHAWEIWGGISSKLWSMPSSHSAYIAVMAVFIGSAYPRLRIIVYPMVAIVALARVQTGAHYLTDVIAGAALGIAICHTAVTFRWGQRLLDAIVRRRNQPQPLAATPSGDAMPDAAPTTSPHPG